MNNRVRKALKAAKLLGLDSFLTCNSDNITYLTGYDQGEGYLLVELSGKLTFFCTFLYSQSAKQISSWEVATSSLRKTTNIVIGEKIRKLKLRKTGICPQEMSFTRYRHLCDQFSKAGTSLVEVSDPVSGIRRIKDKSEIDKIKQSISVTKEALDFSQEIFRPQMSEKSLSIEIDRFLRLKADNQLAFPTIVASGKNTVFPHHQPGNCKIGNKFFLIDLGSKYYGYCADLTRVFFWGKMPSIFQKIYDTVRKAQELAIKKIKDGVSIKEVDRTARDFIGKYGWSKYFGHGLGHGIGLSVHEEPFLGPKSNEVLKEGMVVTVEPAVYYKNKFGIRYEDVVLVKKGNAEILSGDFNR